MSLASAFSMRSRRSTPDFSRHSSKRNSSSVTPTKSDSNSTVSTNRPLSPASSSLPLSIIKDADGTRRSRFMEDVLNAVQPTQSGANANDTSFFYDAPETTSVAQSKQPETSVKATPPGSRGDASISPVSIPTRTSSSHAINGDTTSSPRSARKHKSVAQISSKPKPRPSESEDGKPFKPASRHRLSTSDPAKLNLMSAFPVPPGQSAERDAAPRKAAEDSTAFGGGGVGEESGIGLINGDYHLWSSEKENILKGPFDYLESHPGKDIRSQLIDGFNAWLQVPPASLAIITKVVGMLHTASLLIDDVEDSSLLRRGVPVAHAIFGTAQTINSANYVYFCALQELSKLSNTESIRIYTEELLNLHRGQGMDLFWRDTLTCPSEDDYLEMVGNKTGGLFRLAIKLMCAESPSHNAGARPSSSSHSGHQSDYVPLVNTIGLLFQILDDYRNLSDTSYTANKGLCEDLTEGKFSFPVIHAIRSEPTNLVLINILKQKTKDDEVKRYAVAYMERTGSFAYTRRVLRGLTKKALALVEEVDEGRGRGDAVTAILEKLKVDRHSKTASVAIT